MSAPPAARSRRGSPAQPDGRAEPGRRRAGRGRHATSSGDGFGRLVALTMLGALLPGSGLWAAGWRRSGAVVLGAVALAVGALVALALTGRLLDLALRLVVRPNALAVAAGVLVAAGLAWGVVIVVSYHALRPDGLTGAQQVLSGVLVASLVALVVLPTARAAQFGLVQRDLLQTLFSDDAEAADRDPAAVEPDLTDFSNPWSDVPRVNVLLLGSDAGQDRIGVRPDTIMVASIDTASGETTLISLPRNLERPPFPAGTPAARAWPAGFGAEGGLINGVWAWAEENPHLFPRSASPGLVATRDAVAAVTGLTLDYYATVNLQGFEDLIDAMGGVRVSVPERLPIGGGLNLATGRNYPITGWIEPGRQRLDGYRALWFARSRARSDDYDRMRRQRCLIGAVVQQADPTRLALAFPRLAASAQANVTTDVRQRELDAWVELAFRVKEAEIRSLPLTNEVIDPGSPNYPRIRALVQQAIHPPPLPEPPADAPADADADADVTETEEGETARGEAATEPSPDPTAVDPRTPTQDLSAVCG